MIKIRYSCSTCGIDRVTLEVRERGENEDIIAWMDDAVRPALGADHRKRSPFCLASKLSEVMIPTAEDTAIGQAPRN